MKDFDTFGVMIDMSRNAVMSLPGLKRFMTLLKKMGYNCVMLYTEDTYEVDGEPYFGYMRGRYTKEEMKEIDAFASELGMTVIPCIQTLAHLNAIFRWGQYPNDCDDILLVDDERTYTLIDNMMKTLSECFTSRRIHIGMDEAHSLGRGKFLDKHGYERVNEILKRHLARVMEIAARYGYEVMAWSDMYFRSWNNGIARIPRCTVPEEIVRSVPKELIPVYWDYYQKSEDAYSGMMENHRQFSDKTWFAGGSWCWYGMIPFNKYTIETMLPAIDACRKNNIRNAFMTMWGDDGAECSHFSQLSSLYYIAQYARGERDEERIKAGFERLVGIGYDEFESIDLPNEVVPYNTPGEILNEGSPVNPSKYMLYSDYFNGYLDYTVREGAGEKYKEYSETLRRVARKSRRYGYVFETAARLCDVLAVKYELGVRTRRAYRSGDRDALRALLKNEYARLPGLIDAFGRAFEKQWFCDNKPHGFDVQDHRIGALIRRTEACRRRLSDYLDGSIDAIPELEEELLPYGNAGESISLNKAVLYSTVNIVYQSSVTREK